MTETYTEVYQAWCEYDIGLEDTVFTTVALAELAADANIRVICPGDSFENLREEGLAGVNTLRLVSD